MANRWILVAMASAMLSACTSSTERRTGAPVEPRTTRVAVPRRSAPAPPAVAKRILVLRDRRRMMPGPDGHARPRRLVTAVRYPVAGPGGAARAYPLVVFAHGFAVRPSRYRALLTAWARAGYVVAAPVFPGENPRAPGGPDRRDLLNEPADLRLLIARLRRASWSTPGRGVTRVDPGRIAVAGHSDGGDAALAVAFDPRFRSRRIDAAIILAGADMPWVAPFQFPSDGPALLAVQGRRDRLNPPADTAAFFRRARSPKLLLSLMRDGHFAPYTTTGPSLTVVQRMTVAFLDREVKDRGLAWSAVIRSGRRADVSRVSAVLGGR